MSFFKIKGKRAFVFLAASIVMGPPIAILVFQVGFALYSDDAAALGSVGDDPGGYLLSLFAWGYLQGILPAITACLVLLELRIRNGYLRFWWALAAAYLSTSVWYYFDIIANNRYFLAGIPAIVSAIVLWTATALLWKDKAEAR